MDLLETMELRPKSSLLKCSAGKPCVKQEVETVGSQCFSVQPAPSLGPFHFLGLEHSLDSPVASYVLVLIRSLLRSHLAMRLYHCKHPQHLCLPFSVLLPPTARISLKYSPYVLFICLWSISSYHSGAFVWSTMDHTMSSVSLWTSFLSMNTKEKQKGSGIQTCKSPTPKQFCQ